MFRVNEERERINTSFNCRIDCLSIEEAITYLQQEKVSLNSQGFDTVSISIESAYGDSGSPEVEFYCSRLENDEEYNRRMEIEHAADKRNAQVLERMKAIQKDLDYMEYLRLRAKFDVDKPT